MRPARQVSKTLANLFETIGFTDNDLQELAGTQITNDLIRHFVHEVTVEVERFRDAERRALVALRRVEEYAAAQHDIIDAGMMPYANWVLHSAQQYAEETADMGKAARRALEQARSLQLTLAQFATKDGEAVDA